MGRAPCCDKANVKRGPWSPEEDSKLKEYIEKYGTGGNWIALPQKAGLKRCGKSCRLRWLNYLRPNIKHGEFSAEEDRIICSLFANIGSRWSIIAAQLPGRTDNDIKNYWNTKLKKKLLAMAPNHHQPQRPAKHLPFTSNQATPQPLLFPSHSSLLSSLYKDSTLGSYSSLISTDFESISALSSAPNLSSNTSSSIFQTQEGLAMQYYPVKDNSNSNMLVFGSTDQQASCSSNSDGSCSQMSHGFREIKQEEMGFHQQGYISNGYEDNHKFMLSNYGNSDNNNGCDGGRSGGGLNQFWTEKTSGYFGETSTTARTLDYDHHHQIEDVKQYININSSSSNCTNDNNNNFFIEENKAQQEKIMYYYHC